MRAIVSLKPAKVGAAEGSIEPCGIKLGNGVVAHPGTAPAERLACEVKKTICIEPMNEHFEYSVAI